MSGKMTKKFKAALTEKVLNCVEKPNYIHYIAVDKDTGVWGFNLKPEIDTVEGDCWKPDDKDGKYAWEFPFNMEFDSTTWKNTLIEYESINIDVFIKHEPKIENVKINPVLDGSVLKFKLWQPGDENLICKLIERQNLPEIDKTPVFRETIGHYLITPALPKMEVCQGFCTSEYRQRYVDMLIESLKDVFTTEVRVKATEKDIGKKVDTECGVAELVNLTTDGKFVVMYNGKSDLHICEKAELVGIKSFNLIITTLPDSSIEYWFFR